MIGGAGRTGRAVAEIGARELIAAGAAALVLHGAVAAFLLSAPKERGAAGPGTGGLAVSVSAPGGLPGRVAETLAPDAAPPLETAEQIAAALPAEPAPTADPEAVAATETDPEIASPAAPLAAPLATAARTPGAVTATDAPAPDARQALAPETAVATEPPGAAPGEARVARVSPLPRARPEPPPGPAPRRAATRPAPSPAPEAAAGPVPAAEPGTQNRQSARLPEAGGEEGAAGSAGTGDARQAGGDPGVRRDYLARVAAILARHRSYPRLARQRRQQGTGRLAFTVDASGRVTGARIVASAGFSLLDEEMLALLSRAAPLPPIPPEVGRERLEIVLPVTFEIR